MIRWPGYIDDLDDDTVYCLVCSHELPPGEASLPDIQFLIPRSFFPADQDLKIGRYVTVVMDGDDLSIEFSDVGVWTQADLDRAMANGRERARAITWT